MNGPKRTDGDTMSPVERALLDAGRSFRTKPDTRARTLAALGLATSAAAAGAAGAAGATSISSLAKLTWTKLLIGATLVSGVAAVPGGYYLLHRQNAAAKASGAHVTMRVNHAPGGAEQDEASSTTGEAATPEARAGLRAPAPATPLGPELAAVDAARTALAGGDASGALALLAAYEHGYPHGRLELEAEVLRMDALAASGHADAARKRAEAFLRHHANSVLAARARGYLQPRGPEGVPLPPL